MKDQQQEVHRLEKEISELERKRGELTVELEKPETYQAGGRAMEINRELSAAEKSLHTLGQQWEAASLRLTQLETE
jgi:hypothetical protein